MFIFQSIQSTPSPRRGGLYPRRRCAALSTRKCILVIRPRFSFSHSPAITRTRVLLAAATVPVIDHLCSEDGIEDEAGNETVQDQLVVDFL